MPTLAATKVGRPPLWPFLIILALASILIWYHLIMLYDLAAGLGLSSDANYNRIQGVLRIAIIASLTGVIVGKKPAFWAMWLSIGALIATHYWAHFGAVPVEFTAGRHPLSYLKGLIIPTIVTTAFLYRRKRA